MLVIQKSVIDARDGEGSHPADLLDALARSIFDQWFALSFQLGFSANIIWEEIPRLDHLPRLCSLVGQTLGLIQRRTTSKYERPP